MTNNISEYSAGLAFPELVKTDYDNKLEVALLLKKQTEYDQTLARLNNLQSTALNMAMINLDGAEKLQGYNKELNDMLSQDLGDVTDPRVQAKLAGYFTKIAGDDDLKEKNRISQYYLSQDADIQRRKQAKDPSKEGFNSINQFVYENAEGGKNDFVKAKDTKGWDSKKIGYTPYKDIDTKMVNLGKLLHEETKTDIKYDGYNIITTTTKGVSKERAAQWLKGNLDQGEMEQLQVLSQYRILTANPEELHQSYSEFIQKNKTDTEQKIKYYEAVKKSYDPNNLPPGLSDAEKEIKKIEYEQKQAQADEALTALKNNNNQLIQNEKTFEQWNALSEREKLPFVQQMTWENKVDELSSAVSYMSEMESVTPNRGAIEQAELSLKAQEMAIKAQQSALIAQKEAMGQQPDWSITADQIPNPVDTLIRFTEMQTQGIQYQKNATNIFDPENPNYAFKDPGSFDKFINNKSAEDKAFSKSFTEENKDNHYLSLWYHYRNMQTEAPTLEGFKVFLEKVEKGDYSKDATVQGKMDAIYRDRQVGDWMMEKTREIEEKVGYKNPLLLQSKEGKTLVDYAKETGWNGQGDMVFYFTYTPPPDRAFGVSNESIKLKYTLEEVLSPSFREDVSNRRISVPGGVAQLITNNQMQKEMLEAIVKQSDDSLPTLLQTGQKTLDFSIKKNKEYATLNIIPKINEAYKNFESMGLNSNDIATISADFTGMTNNAYFTLTKEGAQRLNGKTLIGPNGEEIVINAETPQQFKFLYTPSGVEKYDAQFNLMFKDRSISNNGYELMYKNHRIIMRTNPTNGEVNVMIVMPDKTQINKTVSQGTTPLDAINGIKSVIDYKSNPT
jgi:hypothetical protein